MVVLLLLIQELPLRDDAFSVEKSHEREESKQKKKTATTIASQSTDGGPMTANVTLSMCQKAVSALVPTNTFTK